MPRKGRSQSWLESGVPTQMEPQGFGLAVNPEEIARIEISDVVQTVTWVEISLHQKEPVELRFHDRKDAVDFVSNLWRRRTSDSG